MASDPQSDKRPLKEFDVGPFVLRTLFEDVPLSEDGTKDDIKINCVEYLGAHNVRPSRESITATNGLFR